MRYLLIIILSIVSISCSQDETYLGKEPVYTGEIMTVNQILDKKLMNTPVQIKGRIHNVCTTEGCWFIIAHNNAKLRCSFESPTLTMDTLNLHKELTIEGKLTEEIIDAETALIYAEQSGEKTPVLEGSKKRVPIFVVSTILLHQ